MTTDEATKSAVQASLKAKPVTQRQIAARVRRKKLLDKLRDADIQVLMALCRAFCNTDDGKECDSLTDEIIDRMSDESTYEKFEMLCLEVLELRKRLRKMGMDSNWESTE